MLPILISLVMAGCSPEPAATTTHALVAYDLDVTDYLPLRLDHQFVPPHEQTGETNCRSWFLVIDTRGRVIIWPDPRRPYGRIVYPISTERLDSLYDRLFAAGMRRFARDVQNHQKEAEELPLIRPDRLAHLSCAPQLRCVIDESYFAIQLDSAKEDPNVAIYQSLMKIIKQLYNETLKQGTPEEVNYVHLTYTDGHRSIGRGETTKRTLVTDGYFMTEGHGTMVFNRSFAKSITTDTQTDLFARLTDAGLFDLKPIKGTPHKSMYGSLTTIEARIAGQKVRAIATPEVTRILQAFERELVDKKPEKDNRTQ